MATRQNLLRSRAGARARHLRRAVLRPGVRVRGHAVVAHAARAPDARRRAADAVPAAGRVVGVDVHLLVHQLDRPRQAGGAHDDVRADAGGAADVGVDPERVRPRRAAVRDARMRSCRWCARRSCCARRTGTIRPTSSTCGASSCWLVRVGGVLDRGRLRGGRRARGALWLVALALEYLGPFAYFYVPGLGRSSTADWKVDGAHMAERCALFVIIALGESILVTGATAASLPATDRRRLRIPRGVRRQRRDVVDLLQHRRGARQPRIRRLRGSRARGAQRVHVFPHPDRGRHRGVRGGR